MLACSRWLSWSVPSRAKYRSPVPDSSIGLGRPVWAEVVQHDRDSFFGRVQRPEVAAEGQELGAGLADLDVSVEPVGGQVIAGQQVPDSVRAMEGGPSPSPPRLDWIALADRGRRPLPARVGLQVQRPEL